MSANGRTYAIWLRVFTTPTEERPKLRDLGRVSLHSHDRAWANIALNTGGDVTIAPTSRHGIPCLTIRSRFGGDHREAITQLVRYLKSAGLSASLIDETAPSLSLRQKMGWAS